MGQRRHHRLLAHHPVQVPAWQVVALADEAQCLRAVEFLAAGRKVCAGKWFVDRIFEANLDPAERIGDQRETEQSDLGVVVDGDSGEIGDRLDQGLAAGFGAVAAASAAEAPAWTRLARLASGLAVDAVDLRLAQSRAAT